MNFFEGTFNEIKKRHLRIINSILDLIDEKDEKDPFRTAVIIIFLAGIDKILSFTLIFLWIAGKIKAKGVTKYKNTLEDLKTGYISCDYGFRKKLSMLKELGIDLEDLVWLSDLRNHFLHGHSLQVGYRFTPDFKHNKINLCPQLQFTFSESFNVHIDNNILNTWYNEIIKEICNHLDKPDFQKRLELLLKNIKNLPINPEPYYSKLQEVLNLNEYNNEYDKVFEKASNITYELNSEYIFKILRNLNLIINDKS